MSRCNPPPTDRKGHTKPIPKLVTGRALLKDKRGSGIKYNFHFTNVTIHNDNIVKISTRVKNK